MEKIEKIINSLEEVYKNRNYLLLSLLVACFFVSLHIISLNPRVFFQYGNAALMKEVFVGTFTSFSTIALVMLLVLSCLTGIFIALVVYQMKRTRAKNAVASGSSGVLLGIIAPSCASCGLGVLALFGLGGIVTILPFGGVELGIAGTIFLLIAISSLALKISKKTC